MRRTIVLAALCLCGVAVSRAPAVILYDKASRNLGAPGGVYTAAGWQYQGLFGTYYGGTVISKNLFITAEHVGGGVGDYFTFQGKRYAITTTWDDPNSDLRIHRIKGTFPTWAPLNTKQNEVGKLLLVYGRGVPRTDEVKIGTELKGWKWLANGDARLSWGRNIVSSAVDGGAGIGSELQFTFDRLTGIKYEACISRGDSGGGVFVKDGETWKLAGVNYSTDRFFATNNSEAFFEGSMFDKGGLYMPTANNGRAQVPNGGIDVPGVSSVSRISTNMDFITGVFKGTVLPNGSPSSFPGFGSPVPEPGSACVLIFAMAAMTRRRRN